MIRNTLETTKKLQTIHDIVAESDTLYEKYGERGQRVVSNTSVTNRGYYSFSRLPNYRPLEHVRAARLANGAIMSFRILDKNNEPAQIDFTYDNRVSEPHIPEVIQTRLEDVGFMLLRRGMPEWYEKKDLYKSSFQPVLNRAIDILQEEANPSDGGEPWLNAYSIKEILQVNGWVINGKSL